MKPKILVTYATKSGSTAEVAQAIGQKLTEGGATVEVRPIKEVNSLNGYEAVIVGGPMSRLFVQLIIGAPTGDYRHWPAINTWAAHLGSLLRGEAGGV